MEELGLGVVLAAPVAELRARRPLPLLQVNADDIGCKISWYFVQIGLATLSELKKSLEEDSQPSPRP